MRGRSQVGRAHDRIAWNFDRDLNASEPLDNSFLRRACSAFPWTATDALGDFACTRFDRSGVGRSSSAGVSRHRNRELAAARLDLTNEAERERRRIARDLHDQTLADLRNLMITSDKILLRIGEGFSLGRSRPTLDRRSDAFAKTSVHRCSRMSGWLPLSNFSSTLYCRKRPLFPADENA